MEMVNAHATTRTARINFFMKISFSNFKGDSPRGTTNIGNASDIVNSCLGAAWSLGLVTGNCLSRAYRSSFTWETAGLRGTSGCAMIESLQHTRKEQGSYVSRIQKF